MLGRIGKLERFFPDLFVEKIEDIDFKRLLDKNIKGLILDIDNTLVPNNMEEADDRAVKWLTAAREHGLKACLVSNNSRTRVIKFNEKLKLPAIHKAVKPASRAFIKAMKLMELDPQETVVIGDQIFTDVFGGNRLNLFTILVSPMSPEESLMIKFKRLLEIVVLKDFKKADEKRRKSRIAWKKNSGENLIKGRK